LPPGPSRSCRVSFYRQIIVVIAIRLDDVFGVSRDGMETL